MFWHWYWYLLSQMFGPLQRIKCEYFIYKIKYLFNIFFWSQQMLCYKPFFTKKVIKLVLMYLYSMKPTTNCLSWKFKSWLSSRCVPLVFPFWKLLDPASFFFVELMDHNKNLIIFWGLWKIFRIWGAGRDKGMRAWLSARKEGAFGYRKSFINPGFFQKWCRVFVWWHLMVTQLALSYTHNWVWRVRTWR